MAKLREDTFKKHEPRTTVAQTAEERRKQDLTWTPRSAVRDVMSYYDWRAEGVTGAPTSTCNQQQAAVTQVSRLRVSLCPVKLLRVGRIIKAGCRTANVAASWFVYPVADGHFKHNPTDRNAKITVSKRADRKAVT